MSAGQLADAGGDDHSIAPDGAALDVASLSRAVSHVDSLLERPEWLLDPITEGAKSAAEDARSFVKLFFDAAQARCPSRMQKAATFGLGGLVTNGFDHEQIWEELEVQNIPLRRHLRHRLSRLAQGSVDLIPSQPSAAASTGTSTSSKPPRASGQGKKKAGRSGAAQDDSAMDPRPATGRQEGKEGLNSDAEENIGASDAFFSLEDMNKFADMAEAGMRLEDDADDDSDFGALEVDDDGDDEEAKTAMFADFFDGVDESRGVEKKHADNQSGTGSSLKGKAVGRDKRDRKQGAEDEVEDKDAEGEEEEEDEVDEADAVGDGGGEGLSDEERELEDQIRKLQQGDASAGGSNDDDDDDADTASSGEGDKDADDSKSKSLYEMDKRLRSLEEEVAKLEEEQLEEKPWALRGEVSAKQRPLNSLLEVHLDQPMSHFAGRRAEDSGGAPGAGEDDADALEDVPGADGIVKHLQFDIDAIIKQRVWDEAFDDVVRKTELPPSQRPQNNGEDAVEVLNFEKSRVGLGDIYAKQYEADLLGHKTEGEEKEDRDKVEAKALFAKLMYKLDLMTNAHFTPRPVMMGASADQLAKVPSLKMEETIPLMVSDAHLKAPEELKAPRRHEREQAELSHEERVAARRAKKAKRRKALGRRLESGEMTLSGMRERSQVLSQKNADAKAAKAAKGKVKEQKKRLKASELLSQAAQQATTGLSRKEAARQERQQRPADALPSKRLKL